MICDECKKNNPEDSHSCAECGNIFHSGHLASRLSRLSATITDLLIYAVFSLPAIFIWNLYIIEGVKIYAFLSAILALIVTMLFTLNSVLLVQSGQTIGKKIHKIKVVDYRNGAIPNWVNVFLIRVILDTLIELMPGIGAVYSLVDALFIFSNNKRCLHDYLAKTKVVNI